MAFYSIINLYTKLSQLTRQLERLMERDERIETEEKIDTILKSVNNESKESNAFSLDISQYVLLSDHDAEKIFGEEYENKKLDLIFE